MEAAILFEPNGYQMSGASLMGRQSAGHGFLRAAIAARGGAPVIGYTPSPESAKAFLALVREIDPDAQGLWLQAARVDQLAQVGTLYRPDNALAIPARLRLRAGMAAYSLCGVTHTLSSEAALTHIANLFTAPVAPWDAVICTSQAAVEIFHNMFQRHAEYLNWKLGHAIEYPPVQLPVIPLGIHTADFATSDQKRGDARARLEIAADEIVILYAGRLSITAKAHPVAMYRGLQTVAERSGKKLVLIQAGAFSNDTMERIFRTTTAEMCPDVRAVFVNGNDVDAFAATWRAADVFISLADSVQETFGLTPVEAMAAGLPVIASDWNGYKETVREGLDGFRIPTWAPQAGIGEPMTRDAEAGASDYNPYIFRLSTTVSVDQRVLVDRLSDLVIDPSLRARLGASGRERALRTFDWANIYAQYQALWTELGAIRRRSMHEAPWAERIASAPKTATAFADPFALFSHYPTHHVTPETLIEAEPGVNMARFHAMTAMEMHKFYNPTATLAEQLLTVAAHGPVSIADAACALGIDRTHAIEAAARLAKLGLMRLHPPRSV